MYTREDRGRGFMWNTFIAIEDDRFGLKTIGHCIIGIIIFIIANMSAVLFVNVLSYCITIKSIISLLNCCFSIAFFLFLLSLYIRKGLKKQLEFFRINYVKPSQLFIGISIILPCCVIGFYYFFIEGTLSVNTIKIYEKICFALSIGLSTGVCEEVLFRGYIMKLVEIRWNRTIAAFAPSALFGLLHITGGMDIIDILQLLLAGITVGVMFSSVTYAKNTVNNSIVIHGLWNFFILGIAGISLKTDQNVLLSYVIHSENRWITGGRFGIESGLPAIIGYGVVIGVAAAVQRKITHERKY